MRVLAKGWGHDFIQTALDIEHGAPRRKTRAIGDAEDMRIHGNRGLAERDVQNHVGGLSSNPRQGLECFPGIRYLALMAIDQQPAESDEVARLAPEKAQRSD